MRVVGPNIVMSHVHRTPHHTPHCTFSRGDVGPKDDVGPMGDKGTLS